MEFDVDEEEPSALEYARMHGICIDYSTEQPLIQGLCSLTAELLDRDLQDASDASITNAASELIRERLAVNTKTAMMLKNVLQFQVAPTNNLRVMDGRKWILDMKQELPLLRTEHELDLLNFGNATMPDHKDLQIPSEVIKEEGDEGFEWPAKYFAYPTQCDNQAKNDKLAVAREVLVYLQDAIKDTYDTGDLEKIMMESCESRLIAAAQPLTPPLLPMSSPVPLYIPSSPANRLPLASDSSDSVGAEAKLLEQQIMAADSLERKRSDSSDCMLLDISQPLQFSPLFESQLLPITKRKVEDLKVEGPLTPPIFSDTPMKKLKSVSFADTLHQYIPEKSWKFNGSDDDNIENDIDFDDFFQEIEPLAQQVQKQLENEQLSGADTTARVDVPDVDFSLPLAPWNEYSQKKSSKHRPGDIELDAQMKFLLRMKREDLKTATSWHGVTALERNLRWGIFTTNISTINLEEKLHGETDLTKILADITTGNITTSSAQVWKQGGLRIVEKVDDDEEELELEEIEERRDMETLIRKRKLELEDEAIQMSRKRVGLPQILRTRQHPSQEQRNSHHWEEVLPIHQVSNRRSKTVNNEQEASQAPGSRHKSMQPPADTGNELMFGGFSATTALHKFMETRGKPLEAASMASSKGPLPGRNLSLTTRDLPVRRDEPSLDQFTAGLHRGSSLPILPDILNDLKPSLFIVSSVFLQQRTFMKQVEKLYPGADIVYRDYNLPHSVAKEADIILSPCTGLVFATLQQVKQRALPGQPDRSVIKERMSALQLRYERLIVMVGEGLSQEMEQLGYSRPADARDEEALAQFTSFAGLLDGEVLVQFVRGGERALTRATVLEMAKYGLPYGSADIGDIKPEPVETSWEIFLCRTGLNPFAAQVIIALLKQPFDIPFLTLSNSPAFHNQPRTIPVSGLVAFITMNENDRIRYFQAFMGGSRILRRISKVLSQEWVSAAHGFRM